MILSGLITPPTLPSLSLGTASGRRFLQSHSRNLENTTTMSTRAECDAFSRLLGCSQEYLDEVHRRADEGRARLGPLVRWEPASSSDSESDDDHTPLTPPKSPKGDGPDLSRKAWSRRLYSDASIGIESYETGFNNYEKWRSYMISEHAKRVVPVSTSLEKSGVRKRKRRSAVTLSERLELDALDNIPTSLIKFSRLTRSKTSTASVFYELGSDSKTSQPLSLPSSINPTRIRLPRQPITSMEPRPRLLEHKRRKRRG